MPQDPTPPPSSTAIDPFAGLTRDDLKAHIAKSGYKTIEDLAFADLNARRLLGHDKGQILRVPQDANDAEGWAAVRKALGVPEQPNGYGQFQPATGNLALSADQLGALDKAMFDAGAPPAARNAALKTYHEMAAAAEQADEAAWTADVNKNLAALKTEWGQQYEPFLKAGETAAKAVLGEDFTKFLKDARLDDHPTVKRAFYNLAKMTAEDGRVAAIPGAGTGETPAEAQRKIDGIRTHPALRDAAHPEHNAMVAEWKRLHAAAFPA